MSARRIFTHLVSVPWLWNSIQHVLGAPRFKRELYRSKLHPPGTLLDLGCATGHLADAFTEFEYYGVDLDPEAIRVARRRFPDRANMHFLVVDLLTRPFPPDFFDEVLFAGAVHHLDDRLLGNLLSELCYCLKPGGIIHIFDPVFKEDDQWTQKLMRRVDQGKFTRTLPQILGVVESMGLFECGEASFHTPYGALIRDCDFLYLPLRKPAGHHP